jgi:hypothetical protein
MPGRARFNQQSGTTTTLEQGIPASNLLLGKVSSTVRVDAENEPAFRPPLVRC